ncbi:hypothetical protein [Dysgonomonas sp. 511]|uniref:hypothetical protein n=1 Tax=Dysgonomonas sp. 511 TaxID=2302930 RepID=UPI0013D73C29|nr:hypothetical protein [Dysgonomonas sp. 511]NDV79969.1 YtxH domain-containing protein [Dysgonomonas sp. 511]
MKKIIAGAVVGLAASFVAYRLYKQGKFDGMYEDLHKFADKTKRDLKNVVDVSKNQVEYLKGRAEHEISKAKEKVDEMVESHS